MTECKIELLTKEYIKCAVQEANHLTIEEENETGILVWDDLDMKLVPFHYLECQDQNSLADRFHVSQGIPSPYLVDKNVLAQYLWNTCDRNAFITLDELVLIWSEPDYPESLEPSEFQDPELLRLEERFGDEYALLLGSGLLGQLWFERNIVVINMGEIVRTAERVALDHNGLCDHYYSLEHQILVGLLTTAIHELRHLQMDTNVLLPEEEYPLSLRAEDEVETYCLERFENSRMEPGVLPSLFAEKKPPLSTMIDSAVERTQQIPSSTHQNKGRPDQRLISRPLSF